MRIITLFFLTFLTLINLTYQSYNSAAPVWLTSKFMRAGNEDVIKDLTGQAIDPIYTFTFSSALPGIPNLAYGIRRYRGNDFMGVQQFEIRRLELTESTFTVQVDIIGVTNLWIVNVPYIAVDPTFPHHLNSFDNVPISYGTELTNITQTSSSLTSFTNYINYSQQSAGRKYDTFGKPLKGNKMLLYICALHIWATFRKENDMFPIDLHISYNIQNSTTYKLAAQLSTRVRIAKLHFSQIVYNSDDVQSSKKYVIVYQIWETPGTGGFLSFPKQFVDNFIMGVTDFSTIDGKCGFQYQWFFATKDNNFGVEIVESIQISGECGFSRMSSTVFYMKTWQCPQTHPYFNLTNNLCQDACDIFYYENKTVNQCNLCGFSCPICLNSSVCLQCDTKNHYRELVTNKQENSCNCIQGYTQDPFDSTNRVCLACVSNCISCNNTKTCQKCNQNEGYSLTNELTCKLCGIGCADCVSITEGCLKCRETFWLNPETKKCECDSSRGYIKDTVSTCKLCGIGCSDCVSITEGCLTCKETYRLNSRTKSCQCDQFLGYIVNQDSTCKLCGIGCADCFSIERGCLTCRETFLLNPVTNKCECPNVTYLNSRTLSCIRCHEKCLTCMGPTQYECTSCHEDQNRLTLPQANGMVKCLCNPFNYVEAENGSVVCVRRSEEACDYGYIYIRQERRCVQICGDGISFGQFQCDDGNREDGDGCSKTCNVEQGFNCTFVNSASVCMYTETVDIVSAVSYKNPFGNHLLIKCQLSPVKEFFSRLKWKDGLMLIGPNMTVVDAWMQSKWLVINTTYFEDLTGKTLTIKYSSALANRVRNNTNSSRRLFSTVFDFDLTLRDYDLPIAPANNIKPIYFEDSTYHKVELFQRACFIVAICTIVFVCCSMILKTVLPVWQIVFCLQTLFISLGSIKSMNPLLSGLTQFSFIKGFRASVMTIDGVINQDPNMEYNIRILGYGGSVYDNMNVMLIVQLALMITTGALYLMSKKDLTMNFPFQFAKRELMLMILFNCMNFSLSLGLIKTLDPIELTVATSTGIVIIVQIYHFVKNLRSYYYLDQTLNLTQPKLQFVLATYIFLRIVQAVSIALFRSQTLISASILLAAQVIISIGFSKFRPYKNNHYNILNFLSQWAVTAFLTINIFLNLEQIELQSTQNTISVAQICLKYLIVAILVITFWYSFVKDYCMKKAHSLKIIWQKEQFESLRVKDSKSGNKIEIPSLSLHKASSQFLVQDLTSYGSKQTSIGMSSLNHYAYPKKGSLFQR